MNGKGIAFEHKSKKEQIAALTGCRTALGSAWYVLESSREAQSQYTQALQKRLDASHADLIFSHSLGEWHLERNNYSSFSKDKKDCPNQSVEIDSDESSIDSDASLISVNPTSILPKKHASVGTHTLPKAQAKCKISTARQKTKLSGKTVKKRSTMKALTGKQKTHPKLTCLKTKPPEPKKKPTTEHVLVPANLPAEKEFVIDTELPRTRKRM